MARSERRVRVKRRLQGVAFLAVVAALLGLTIAIYNKSLPWQASDVVYLNADRAGNQLVVPADVKLDGVLVGRVSGVTTQGDIAHMTLQIDKSKIASIPANVEARILPKTLFGEKFVELVTPGQPAAQALAAGDTIPQDRSQTAIELQTVFSHLVPLLRTLKPAQLSITLSNLAEALHNRGDALGQNLQLVNDYFSRFNKDLPNFKHDISALADLANNYADATPDLLATLRNFSANARTFTVKQDTYARFLTGTSDFARTATQVFGDNAQRLITLAHVSAPVLGVYAKYSKILECLPNGLAIYDRTRLEQAFGGGPFLHITLTPVGDRGAYTPADRNLKSDITTLKLAANCFGLPYGNHDLHPVISRYPGKHPSDNVQCAGYAGQQQSQNCPPPGTSGAPSSRRTSGTAAAPPRVSSSGPPGSKPEQDFIQRLLAPLLGKGVPPGLTDLLVGPLLRGMAVSLS